MKEVSYIVNTTLQPQDCFEIRILMSNLRPPLMKIISTPLSKSLLSHNRVLQTASLQIAPEEPNLPRLIRNTLSQLHSSFCSSLHPYREKKGLNPSPSAPSCGVQPHTIIHVFSCSSLPTPLTKLDLWEHPRLASEILFDLPFFDLPPLPPPPPEQPSSREQES